MFDDFDVTLDALMAPFVRRDDIRLSAWFLAARCPPVKVGSMNQKFLEFIRSQTAYIDGVRQSQYLDSINVSSKSSSTAR